MRAGSVFRLLGLFPVMVGSPTTADAQPAPASAAIVTKSITVSHFTSGPAAIDEMEARAILAATSKLFQVNDGRAANGRGDVSCGVALQLQGPVTSFSTVGTIRSRQQFAELCAKSGLNVVNQILWCGGGPAAAGLLGCSDRPGTCIVVVRRNPAAEPVLWAHEYGHNRNLVHSCEEPNCSPREDDRLMHPIARPAHLKIDEGECKLLR